HVSQRIFGESTVETREPAPPEGVGHGLTLRVVDAGIAAGDRRIDIFGTVERLVARVAAWLIRKLVGSRVGDIGRVRGADAAALGAMDRDTNVVGERLRAGRGPGRCQVRRDSVIPFG